MKASSQRSLQRALLASLFVVVVSVSVACVAGNAAAPAAVLDASAQPSEPDDTDAIPCGPRLVLQTVCQRCHQRPPIRGAPFPLVTRSNIVRIGPDGEIRLLMIQQLETKRMPLVPETIEDDARATLLEWLHAGAPAASPSSCETADAGAPDAPVDASAGTEDAS
jgi:mono/diheme cytochrome c family protein